MERWSREHFRCAKYYSKDDGESEDGDETDYDMGMEVISPDSSPVIPDTDLVRQVRIGLNGNVFKVT